MSELLWSGK